MVLLFQNSIFLTQRGSGSCANCSGPKFRKILLCHMHIAFKKVYSSAAAPNATGYLKLITWLSKESLLIFLQFMVLLFNMEEGVTKMYTPPFEIVLSIIRLLKSSFTHIHLVRIGNLVTVSQATSINKMHVWTLFDKYNFALYVTPNYKIIYTNIFEERKMEIG